MSAGKIDSLYKEYTEARFLEVNKEQFTYIAHLLPACILVMSDGQLDSEEWMTLKRLSKILGDEFATEDLGTDEKEENLMLIYKAEIRYLLKNREMWESKFLEALKEHLQTSPSSKEFLNETLDLFAGPDADPDPQEKDTYDVLKRQLGL
ncbi:hypothetical protein [Fulvivirga lutea]|uniref:Uncharacterized protein n=1 Tax=Fulvivirga lutea TaxID=2810512 RepID=A0A974WH12_9BACT|nr:hypothetical protein [Fulvivirga lutea]QSE97538.1 hypothetical protein JR347_00165 [Fulvivirga lutea]